MGEEQDTNTTQMEGGAGRSQFMTIRFLQRGLQSSVLSPMLFYLCMNQLSDESTEWGHLAI